MTTAQILLVVFCIAIAWNVVYYLYLFIKLRSHKSSSIQDFPAVSVILCSRDHGYELERKLESILTQDYPDFEVVVVDDFSSDESKNVLLDLKIKYPQLKPVFLDQLKTEHVNKKEALTTGILFAKNNILLHTDADCKPLTNQWIKSMVSGYSNPNKQIVLGYGKYENTGGFLNKIIRYDAFLIALQYLFFSKTGNSYMAVGRNLSYTKELFRSSKGFLNHRKMDSGDDDLFVQSNSTKTNTEVVLDPNSFTVSTARNTWGGWILQKIRHTTTAVVYKTKYKWLLMAMGVFRYLDFLILLPWLIMFWTQYNWLFLILGLFCFRLIVQYFVLNYMSKQLKETDLPVLFIIFELTLLFLYPLFIFGKYFTNHQRS